MLRSFFLLLFLLLFLVSVVGCGGSASKKSEMMRIAKERAARNRQAKEEEVEQQPNASPTPADTSPAASESSPADAAPAATETAKASPARTEREPEPQTTVIDVAKIVPIEHPLAGKPHLTKPSTPLTLEQRRQRSIDNLTAISLALQAYIKDNGTLPPTAIYRAGRPRLSWRVALLPYLGHTDLFNKFNRGNSWSDDENSELLQSIPAVFQSPTRFNEMTNYVLVTGKQTAFADDLPTPVARITDGMSNTVLLVEVNDRAAVPWTKPEDYELDASNPKRGLFGLYTDGVFAIWGDGAVQRIPQDISDSSLLATFTIAGAENLEGVTIRVPAEAKSPEPETASLEAAATAEPTDPAETTNRNNASTSSTSRDPKSPKPDAPPARIPVPSDLQIEQAKLIFKELYEAEYLKAKSRQEKANFARKMIGNVEQVKDDPASHYVLLRIVMDVAIAGGSDDLALSTLQELDRTYVLPDANIVLNTLKRIAQTQSSRSSRKLIEFAEELTDASYDAEDYDTALNFIQIAVTSAKNSGDGDLNDRLTSRVAEIEEARTAFRASERALETLDKEPDDRLARLNLAKYLCFVKNNWLDGLPILASSGDQRIQQIAKLDLAGPSSAEKLLEVADGWWDLSESASALQQRSMRQRAAIWYNLALPQLSPGFLKIKIERRLEQASQEGLAQN